MNTAKVLPKPDICDESDPWQALASAVVMQAVKDYRNSRTMLRKLNRNMTAKKTLSMDEAAFIRDRILDYRAMLNDTRGFILSDDFFFYSGLDGIALLQRLEREKR